MQVPVAKPYFGEEELENVSHAMRTGWISSRGDFVSQFEEAFAELVGVKHGVTCNTGTAALHLALLALRIGPGDEVIMPSLTYIATANAVEYCGATTVLADVDPDTWCLDPDDLRRRITPATKGIIPVHLYGNPCDMDPLTALAKEKELWLVEDCAESHGATYRDKPTGSFGAVSCFSFYGNKLVTTGEGGMCTTNSDDLDWQMRYFRNQCVDENKNYWHPEVGYNYRMTNLQAAVGVAQVKRLGKILQKKREIFESYASGLEDLVESEVITFQKDQKDSKPAYWMINLALEDDAGISRDDFMARLADKGVDTRPVFYPLNVMPPYRSDERFEHSQRIASQGVSLPSGPDITEGEIEYVCETIRGSLNG